MVNKNNYKIFVPDSTNSEHALSRTTHLCIAAHPDDIEIMAFSGISECFQKHDKWFSGVVLTNGGGSPRKDSYQHVSDQQMVAIRCNEQKKAAIIGEYSAVIMLDHTSDIVKKCDDESVTLDIMNILEQTRPEALYIHNPFDKHSTHVASCVRCINALRKLPCEKRPKNVFGCEVWGGLDWLADSHKVMLDCGQDIGMAFSLVNAHRSQILGVKQYGLANIGRMLSNAIYMESHEPNSYETVTYAVDLAPLILDENLGIFDYCSEILSEFVKGKNKLLKNYTV